MAICDRHCNVLAPFVAAPGNQNASPLLVPALGALTDIAKAMGIELRGSIVSFDGVYDSKAELLTLRQNIVFKSTSGFEVYLTEAVVDVHSSNIVSEKPVVVRMQQGTINANRLEVTDSGDTIRFAGGVTMVMTAANHAMHLDGKSGMQ